MAFHHKCHWSKQIYEGRFNMADNENTKIIIDDVEYNLNELSDNAKAQLANIQLVDAQLQQLNNEWAVSDTARIGYTNALRTELTKKETSE